MLQASFAYKNIAVQKSSLWKHALTSNPVK